MLSRWNWRLYWRGEQPMIFLKAFVKARGDRILVQYSEGEAARAGRLRASTSSPLIRAVGTRLQNPALWWQSAANLPSSVGQGLPVILPRRHGRKALNHTHSWANHQCSCCYAAACSSASKRQSQQGASLAKVEPRAPRHERRRVAVADVAEKIRFHMPFWEKLLLARLTFARRKELLIEFCVIEA